MMAEPVRARLAAAEPEIIAAVVDRSGRPREPAGCAVTGDLVRALVTCFAGLLPGAARVDDERWHLDVMNSLGARFSAAGVSHAGMLDRFQSTLIELSRRVWDTAEAADVAALLNASPSFAREVEHARAALSEAFRVALAATGPRAIGRRSLAETVLTGQPVTNRMLLAANVNVANQYLVLCVPAADPRPVDGVLDRLRVTDALAHHDGDVMWVLLPASRRSLATSRTEVAVAGFARLAAVVGASVAGASTAEVGAVPEAAEEARAVLDIAVACERRGVVLAEQVLVERALVGSSSAMEDLVRVIAVLERWPYLLRTLRALYDHDLDRSSTAVALHIARRTLAKRIERIHQLTRLHPASARGVHTFMSALAARSLIAECSTPRPERRGS